MLVSSLTFSATKPLPGSWPVCPICQLSAPTIKSETYVTPIYWRGQVIEQRNAVARYLFECCGAEQELPPAQVSALLTETSRVPLSA